MTGRPTIAIFSLMTPVVRAIRVLAAVAATVLVATGCGPAPPRMTTIPTSVTSPVEAVVVEVGSTPTPMPTVEPAATLTPAGPVATESPTAAQVAPSETASVDDEVGIQNMFRSVNNVRATAGCPPVSMDERIRSAAANHATDLAARGAIDHLGADGATFEDRLTRAGYPFQLRAEILGRGSIQTVVDGWLNEPDDGPHRKALLNCGYTAAGVGLGWAPDGLSYWVVALANE